MNATIVDASAVAAVVFNEPEAEPIVASLRGRLLAPTLLRYELASVCSSRLLRHPERRAEVLERYQLASALEIEQFEPDWPSLPAQAQLWGLSAYDAAYLQLALQLGVPLLTLDARLAAAWDRMLGH